MAPLRLLTPAKIPRCGDRGDGGFEPGVSSVLPCFPAVRGPIAIPMIPTHHSAQNQQLEEGECTGKGQTVDRRQGARERGDEQLAPRLQTKTL